MIFWEDVRENMPIPSKKEKLQINAEIMLKSLLLQIQSKRNEKNISQDNMANRSGLVQEAISRIETQAKNFDDFDDWQKGIKVSTLFKLIKSLDLNLCLILNEKRIKVETIEELITVMTHHRNDINKSTRQLSAENGMKQPSIVRFETTKTDRNFITVAKIAIPLGIDFELEEIKKN